MFHCSSGNNRGNVGRIYTERAWKVSHSSLLFHQNAVNEIRTWLPNFQLFNTLSSDENIALVVNN